MRFGTLVALAVGFTSSLAVSWTAWGALPSEMAPVQGASVVVNEVQYDPAPSGGENAYEWVELLNVGSTTVSLEGWSLGDNRATDEIPPSSIGPGEFLVVAGGDGFGELFPDFGGPWVSVGGSIGNGLGNTGDQVRLIDAAGTVVDGMSYGGDAGVLDPSAPLVATGHSLERVPAGTDTDSAADWMDREAPSPGGPASGARPTTVPPTVPPPTLAPGTRIALNELMPAPRDIDWDGDGTADKEDEWVELYNPGDGPIDLRGWQLDDVADGGSDAYVFPEGSMIAPRGYFVVFKRDSGLALNNGGDSVRLLLPDGTVADATDYRNAAADTSFSRDGDGAGPWTDQLPPSPGRTNGSAGGTPGPRPVPSSDPGPDPSATATPLDSTTPSATAGTPAETTTPQSPGTPGVLPTPTAPTAPSGTSAPPDLFLPYLLTEVMFDPLPTGNDAAHEWIELYNPTDRAGHLVGWSVGDRTGWDRLPEVDIAARGFLVVAASPLALAGADTAEASHVIVADGRIGGGLANRGDVVRLRGPTGAVVDAVSYGENIDAFDPAVPIGSPGQSVERIPPHVDSDTADDWWPQPAPSPGRAGVRVQGPPAVRLNELLAAPRRVDWNGDGVADHTDEWVELYNGSTYTVDLSGWRLEVGEPRRWTYRVAPGTRLTEHGFLLVYRHESGLALGNDQDELRLVRDDGVVADRFAWTNGAGYDGSWSRTVDGSGEWTHSYAVTPGMPNAPRPSATDRGSSESAGARAVSRADRARATDLRDVRGLADGVLVQVRGRITVAPGVFSDRETYVGDAMSGLRIYLRPKDMRLHEVDEGSTVIATGVLHDYHGERELLLEAPTDLWVDDRVPVAVIEPTTLLTGDVGEGTEGALVRIGGIVTDIRGATLTIDDGTGPARVVARASSGVRRPGVGRGEWLAVVGIVSQYAQRKPWEGGYRLTPRRSEDYLTDGDGQAGSLPRLWPKTGHADLPPLTWPKTGHARVR